MLDFFHPEWGVIRRWDQALIETVAFLVGFIFMEHSRKERLGWDTKRKDSG